MGAFFFPFFFFSMGEKLGRWGRIRMEREMRKFLGSASCIALLWSELEEGQSLLFIKSCNLVCRGDVSLM